jgi:hypothetical protein
MLFEEHPWILIVLVLLIVEIWLRVREPFFERVVKLTKRDRGSQS